MKKKKFAEAIFQGKNQREAAIEAGYSEKTARSKGSQLAKDKDVIIYLERLTGGVNSHNLSEEELKDPIMVMTLIMVSNIASDPELALDAAAKLAPYVHRKIDKLGKKQLQEEKAQAVNRFAALPTPTLKH